MSIKHFIFAFVVWFVSCYSVPIRAEFVALEQVVAPIAEEISSVIGKKTVVVSIRNVSKAAWPWPVHEAIALELTLALRAKGIDAIRSAMDHRIESFSDGKLEFTVGDAKRIKLSDRDLLVAGYLSTDNQPKLRVAVLSADDGKSLLTKPIDFSKEPLSLDANVPEMNRKVVAFCRDNFDKCVGSGVCAQLASVSLETAGAKRSGVYTWGRELDEKEAILPGDIIQLEDVKLKQGKFSRGFPHHTAIVEDVRPDAIIVLHQNVGEKGKIVQRDSWPITASRTGAMIFFRPWTGESPLPSIAPRRRIAPKIAKRGKSIDVLRTIDPRLDSVRGIWFIDEGKLLWNRDDFARMQIPIAPPDKYTLRLRVERKFGDDQFGIGLVVGGHQTLVSIDGYNGKISGLHRLDGKKSNANATTFKGTILTANKPVNLVVKASPNSILLQADGKKIIDWTGDASRLSQDEKYVMPNTNWLYLASFNSQCAISEFLLDEE